MFSKSCEYALRAMLYIAAQSVVGMRVGSKEVATKVGAPEQFAAKILQQLVRAGLLQSAKGPTGGFYLDSEHADCSLAEIVRVIDGGKLLAGCALGLKACDERHPCPLHHQFVGIRSQINKVLRETTISSFHQDLADELIFLKY